MLVRELIELLARENPDSPVTLEGYCPHGDYLLQDDIYIDHDEGPADDVDEVNICWLVSEEVEDLTQQRAAEAPPAGHIP